MKLSRLVVPAVLGLVGLFSTYRSAHADLLVLNQSNNSVQRFSDTGTNLGAFVTSGSGGLSSPYSLSIRASDNSIFLASTGTNSIKRYSGIDGSYLGDFVTGATNPRDNLFGPDNNLYVSNSTANTVTRYDGSTGAALGTFVTSGSGGLALPVAMTFMPGGDLLVSSGTTAAVKRYNGTTGAYLGDFVTGVSNPRNAVFGPDGNFYLASGNTPATSAIGKYNGTTGAFISNFATTNVSNPIGLAFGPDNNLYVSNFGSDNITRYDGATGAYIGTFGTSVTSPREIAFFTPTAVATPEPSTYAMMALGLVTLCVLGARRKKDAQAL
jgi:hypothetical protein